MTRSVAYVSPHIPLSSAQYFVSSGFAFIHADSTTDVCAVEAVPLEQLDPELVKQASILAHLARQTMKLVRCSARLHT